MGWRCMITPGSMGLRFKSMLTVAVEMMTTLETTAGFSTALTVCLHAPLEKLTREMLTNPKMFPYQCRCCRLSKIFKTTHSRGAQAYTPEIVAHYTIKGNNNIILKIILYFDINTTVWRWLVTRQISAVCLSVVRSQVCGLPWLFCVFRLNV
jgi:hypothetical protein